MDEATSAARARLAEDMKAVIADTEELLKATVGAAGERVSAARTRAEETLRSAKAKLVNLDDAALDKAKEAARATDGYVHQNPWAAIGIAAVAGLLVGVMISRR